MKRLAARFLAPLTLFEWGSIFTYFSLSHRLVAFLSPGFRPLGEGMNAAIFRYNG